MRVLCDTNVLVRAIMSPAGPAAELLTQLSGHKHTHITSPPILGELYDVLRRPNVRRIHRLTDVQIRRAVSRLYKVSTVVNLPPDIPTAVPHDPKDDPIVLTAVIGKAEVLCTLDRHLHAQKVIDYCAPHGVRVLRDDVLLAELR